MCTSVYSPRSTYTCSSLAARPGTSSPTPCSQSQCHSCLCHSWVVWCPSPRTTTDGSVSDTRTHTYTHRVMAVWNVLYMWIACNDVHTHSFTHPLTYSLTHLLTHSLTHSLTHPSGNYCWIALDEDGRNKQTGRVFRFALQYAGGTAVQCRTPHSLLTTHYSYTCYSLMKSLAVVYICMSSLVACVTLTRVCVCVCVCVCEQCGRYAASISFSTTRCTCLCARSTLQTARARVALEVALALLVMAIV